MHDACMQLYVCMKLNSFINRIFRTPQMCCEHGWLHHRSLTELQTKSSKLRVHSYSKRVLSREVPKSATKVAIAYIQYNHVIDKYSVIESLVIWLSDSSIMLCIKHHALEKSEWKPDCLAINGVGWAMTSFWIESSTSTIVTRTLQSMIQSKSSVTVMLLTLHLGSKRCSETNFGSPLNTVNQ